MCVCVCVYTHIGFSFKDLAAIYFNFVAIFQFLDLSIFLIPYYLLLSLLIISYYFLQLFLEFLVLIN